MNTFNSISSCNLKYNQTTPPPPKDLSILFINDTSIIISFNVVGNQAGITYQINITPITSITTSGTPSSFTISGLSPNTNYSINIQCQNSNGLSEKSTSLNFKTLTLVDYTATGNYSTSSYTNTSTLIRYTIVTFIPTNGSFKCNNANLTVGYIVVGGGAGGSYGYTTGVYNGGTNYSSGAGGAGGGISYSPYSNSNVTFNLGTTYNITVGSGGAGGTGTAQTQSTGVSYGGDSSMNTQFGFINAYGGVSHSVGRFSGERCLIGALNIPSKAYTYPPCDNNAASSNLFNTGIGYKGVYNGRGGNGGYGSINRTSASNGYLSVDLSNLSITTVNGKYLFGGYRSYSNNLLSENQTLNTAGLYPSLYYVCINGGDLINAAGLKTTEILADINIDISNFCGGGGGGSAYDNTNNKGNTLTYGAGGGGNGGTSSLRDGRNGTSYGCGGGGGYNYHDALLYGNGGNGYSGCIIIYFPTYA